MNTACWGFQLLAQIAPGSPGEAAGRIPSVWDFVMQGGARLAPLFVCSLVALALIIERLVSLRRRRVIPPDFVSGVKLLMPDGTGDVSRALEYCRTSATPIANVFAAAIRHLHEPLERLEKCVEEAGQRELVRLRKNLRPIGVISSIAVLLGLLGTVFGMITAFQTVARSAEALGKTELLAKGVYEALIATATGLLVAIPTLILYHYFSSRVDALVGEIDELVGDFVDDRTRAAQPLPAPPPVPASVKAVIPPIMAPITEVPQPAVAVATA